MQLIPAEPQIDQTLAHRGVLCIHQLFLDQFQKPGDACFGFLMILTHLPEPIPVAILAFDRRAQKPDHSKSPSDRLSGLP